MRGLFFFTGIGYHGILVIRKKPMKKSGSLRRASTSSSSSTEGVVVRRSFAGLGLFADRDFRKGERVIEYIGNRILSSESDTRPNRYLFQVNSKWDIDGSPRWNIARYVNHSCRPNCEAVNRRGRIFIVSTRAIRKGDEFCYDYGQEYVHEYIRPYGCRCVACRRAQKRKDPV